VPLGGDPWRMAPFKVGDYITVKGPLAADAAGHFLSAWGIDGSVGIFTTPGTLPSYVGIDVLLLGTGPTIGNVANLAQEAARRARVEGFTTDISTTISINAVDVDPCTGNETDRLWAVQAVDPGAPTGAVAGRWRFRPGAPLFDLKGFPFLPPTRELHAFSLNGVVTSLNLLSAGEYTAPNFEFIGPENLGIGNPKVPFNFDTMEFLAQGSGPRDPFMGAPGAASLGVVRQLSPWPGQTPPVLRSCAVPPIANAGANQTVGAGNLVVLNGSASSDPNVPALPLTFAWTQTAGPAVTITNPTGQIAGFRAPVVGGVTLTFQLAVSNGPFTSTATVNVTVSADATRPTATNLTTIPLAPIPATATTVTLSVTATDNVGGTGIASVTFTFNGVTSVVTTPTVAGGSTYQVVVPKPAARVLAYALTATPRDNAGNIGLPVATTVKVN
jgi:hypothetical protein